MNDKLTLSSKYPLSLSCLRPRTPCSEIGRWRTTRTFLECKKIRLWIYIYLDPHRWYIVTPSMWIRNLEELTGVAAEIVSWVDACLWQGIAGSKRSADKSKGKQKFLLHGGDRVSDGLSLLKQPQALYHHLLFAFPCHNISFPCLTSHPGFSAQWRFAEANSRKLQMSILLTGNLNVAPSPQPNCYIKLAHPSPLQRCSCATFSESEI